jgi:hypothetical protein
MAVVFLFDMAERLLLVKIFFSEVTRKQLESTPRYAIVYSSAFFGCDILAIFQLYSTSSCCFVLLMLTLNGSVQNLTFCTE